MTVHDTDGMLLERKKTMRRLGLQLAGLLVINKCLRNTCGGLGRTYNNTGRELSQ